MRRREAGWGAVSGGQVTQDLHSGRRRAPPGPLRDPARSWLTTLGSIQNAGDHFSRGAFQAQEWRGAGNGVRIAGERPMAKARPALG